jgi:hypothetical protein
MMSEDETFIREEMYCERLFASIVEPSDRGRILENILSLTSIIPTLKTFDGSVKYFAVGARILRRHVIPDHNDMAGTLLESMAWYEPVTPRIEVAEGMCLPLLRLTKGQAFKLLFLFAIRNFPHLSNERPLQDKRGETMSASSDSTYVYLLYTLAQQLGFFSPKITEGLKKQQPTELTRQYVVNSFQSKWKCGIPRLRAFLEIQAQAFLPQMGEYSNESFNAMFVFQDFINSFFGHDDFEIDLSASPLTLLHHALKLKWVALKRDFTPSKPTFKIIKWRGLSAREERGITSSEAITKTARQGRIKRPKIDLRHIGKPTMTESRLWRGDVGWHTNSPPVVVERELEREVTVGQRLHTYPTDQHIAYPQPATLTGSSVRPVDITSVTLEPEAVSVSAFAYPRSPVYPPVLSPAADGSFVQLSHAPSVMLEPEAVSRSSPEYLPRQAPLMELSPRSLVEPPDPVGSHTVLQAATFKSPMYPPLQPMPRRSPVRLPVQSPTGSTEVAPSFAEQLLDTLQPTEPEAVRRSPVYPPDTGAI